jgi:hypothetical protein
MKTESTWARPHLETVARDVLEHVETAGIRLVANVLVLDSKRYISQQQFEKEKRGLFSRVPVWLALSCLAMSVLMAQVIPGNTWCGRNGVHNGSNESDGQRTR